MNRGNSIIGGNLLPIMGSAVGELMNMVLVFRIEHGHRLGNAGTSPSGIRTKKQSEAGTDEKSNKIFVLP